MPGTEKVFNKWPTATRDVSGDSEGSSGRAGAEGQDSGENWKARLKAEASP